MGANPMISGYQPVDASKVRYTHKEVLIELRTRVAAAGGVMKWARLAGLSHTPVSLALSGERPVTEQIANACGFVTETVFRKIARGVS